MKSIKFFSLLAAEQHLLEHQEDIAVISIISPKTKNPIKEQFGRLENFIEFVFYDLSLKEYPEVEKEGYKCFDLEMAKNLVEFVELVKDKVNVNEIVVHCEGGFSRSAAVVKFISDFYFPDIPVKTYVVYNYWVYELLKEAKNATNQKG
jgi:protein-tyrosine phosphatase